MEHDAFYNMGNEIVSNNHPNSSEVEYRTAVGRIYYYVYHEILTWVESDEELNSIYDNSEIKSTHKKLVNVFFESAKKTKNLNYGTITRLLSTLHGFRCKADYILEELVDKALFESLLINLEDLKNVCLKFNSGLFQSVIEVKPNVIGSHTTNCANIEVRKRPTLRLLD